MAKKYQLSAGRRIINVVIGAFIRAGLPMGSSYLLTTRGRKTGKLHSFPVTLIEQEGQQWLVAPYGTVSWVYNARAAGTVTISRGRMRKTMHIQELVPDESAPILKEYLTRIPIVRPFFDVTPQSPLSAFVDEAPRHPVFKLIAD
jgi:deazaflavin-dependent oxidoreductase (nitroreductase family)